MASRWSNPAMSQKNNLTAWERWELASLEGNGPPPSRPPIHARKPVQAEVAPVVVEIPVPLEEVQIPTAEEIEQIHQQAHDTGYQEGREEGLRSGHEEGYQAGYKEGRSKGDSEGRVAGETAATQLTAIAGKLDTALAALDGDVAEELTALALEIAREVLRQTIALHPETVVGVVRDALTQLPHQHANIYLHPDDAALVRSYAGDQLTHAGHRIHEDARLQRNDVSIEAGGAHVDATLTTRWRRVVETLGRDVAWDGRSLPPIEEVPTTPEISAAPAEAQSETAVAAEAPSLPEQAPTTDASTADLPADAPLDASSEVLPEALQEELPASALDAAPAEDILPPLEPQADSPPESPETVEAPPEEAPAEPSITDAAAPETALDTDWSEDPLAHLTDDTPLPGVDGQTEGDILGTPPEGEA